MKKLILAFGLFLACLGAQAQNAAPAAPAFPVAPAIVMTDADFKAKVSAFIDSWHDDAAHARLSYFDKMAPEGVFIGTDKTELWKREAFREWAKPHFAKGRAWSFKALKRHVYMAPDRSYVWFDELLDTQMGPCQASGVIHNTGSGFLIEHYQLSMAVPNAVGKQVTDLIKEYEADGE